MTHEHISLATVQAPPTKQGSTLAELVVCLAIVTLVTGIGLTFGGDIPKQLERRRFEQDTQKIYLCMRDLRRRGFSQTNGSVKSDYIQFTCSSNTMRTSCRQADGTVQQTTYRFDGRLNMRISNKPTTITLRFYENTMYSESFTLNLKSPTGFSRNIVVPVAGADIYMTDIQTV